MKILITGGTRFIGRNLAEQLGEKHAVGVPCSSELGLRDAGAVREYLDRRRFDVVIQAAGERSNRLLGSGALCRFDERNKMTSQMQEKRGDLLSEGVILPWTFRARFTNEQAPCDNGQDDPHRTGRVGKWGVSPTRSAEDEASFHVPAMSYLRRHRIYLALSSILRRAPRSAAFGRLRRGDLRRLRRRVRR